MHRVDNVMSLNELIMQKSFFKFVNLAMYKKNFKDYFKLKYINFIVMVIHLL